MYLFSLGAYSLGEKLDRDSRVELSTHSVDQVQSAFKGVSRRLRRARLGNILIS